jgi:hypothetical protein
MRWVRFLGCVLVLSLSAASSAAAFTTNKAGNIVDKQLGNQVFKFNAGAVECIKVASTGAVPLGAFEFLKDKWKFGECTAFGLAATVSEAELEFADAKGFVSFLNVITIEVPVAGCKITIKPGAANQERKAVAYANKAATFEVKLAVAKITYESVGGLCGAGGVNGTLSGNSEVELLGAGAKIEA